VLTDQLPGMPSARTMTGPPPPLRARIDSSIIFIFVESSVAIAQARLYLREQAGEAMG
jgi:hypothetical protein